MATKEKIVVDASVVLAVVLNEPEKERIVTATQGAILIAPACLHWEIGNAFSAMLKRRKLTETEALKGLRIYEIIPIQESISRLPPAIQLCAKHDIYAYDAYYLELAQRGSSPLLTLDTRMAQVARSEAIKLKKI